TGTLPRALDAVFVVNSGSEANDLAWRIARAATRHSGAVVTGFAYHGLTEATHALSPEEWAAGERPAHVATVPGPDGYRGAYRRGQEGRAGQYAPHGEGGGGGPGRRGRRGVVRAPALPRRGHPRPAARLPARSSRESARPRRPADRRRGPGGARAVREPPVELPPVCDQAGHRGDGQADGQ